MATSTLQVLDEDEDKDRQDPTIMTDAGAKPAGKRKKDTAQRDEELPLTLDTFKALLEQQTRDIRRSSAEEIQRAVEAATRASGEEIHRAIEKATAKTTAHIVKVEGAVNRHSDAIAQMRDDMENLEQRLTKAEGHLTSSMGSTQWTETDKKKHSLIFGGWPEDTPRDVLIPDLWELLHKVGLDDQMQDIFTTGPRRGFAIGNVKVDTNVDAAGLKKKLIDMTITVRRAAVRSERMAPGKVLWSNLSKGKTERERGAHGSKLKRLILEISGEFNPGIEVEYPAGTAWIQAGMIGSATKAPPEGITTSPGRSAGSWVHITRIAAAFNMKEEDVEAKWRAILE